MSWSLRTHRAVEGGGPACASGSPTDVRRATRSLGNDVPARWRPSEPTVAVARILKGVFGLMVTLTAAPGHAQTAPQGFFSQVIDTDLAVDTTIYDFNGDGRDDLLINGHRDWPVPKERIWYWTPQGYRPSEQLLEGIWGDRHGCDAADVNHDGRLDLYCMQGAALGSGAKSNELWMQQPDGTFVLKEGPFGAEDPWGRGRDPIFLNFNGDDYPDLYVTNYSIPREDGYPNINQIYVNAGDDAGMFVAWPTAASGQQGSRCVAKGDWNGDGLDDLVLCNHDNASYTIMPGRLFQNTGTGNFSDVSSLIHSGNRIWRDAILEDINQDGWDDLIVITEANALEVRLNSTVGARFTRVSFSASLSRYGLRVVVGDFDHDNNRDIYVVRYGCKNNQDSASDLMFFGPSWTRKVEIPQKNPGCVWKADVVDGDKVLLMHNGWAPPEGTNELIGDWRAFSRVYGLTSLSSP